MKKKILLLSVLVVGLISFSFLNPANNLPIGATIPESTTSVKDISGKSITLKDAKKENGLLVMFTCNTCPYVINNQGRTKEICQYAMDKKLGVVLLNANEGGRDGDDSFESMQAYAKRTGYSRSVIQIQNHSLADAFAAKRTPECYLFDKSGVLVYHGAIDDSPGDVTSVKRHHLKEAINEMTNGKAVTVKESRSVGCSINRG